ncbi:hypothetical protein FRC04_005719 [Tulasnella sp. 424]|nr:hypothetical protein FRC04_005719 [Tulasnella sp. 424]
MRIIGVGDDPEEDPTPVSTLLTVDPSMAPSPAALQHPPPSPPSPPSSVSDELSDTESGFPGFRVYSDQEHEIHDIADTSAQALPSSSTSLPTADFHKPPVSLPLSSSQWKGILAGNIPHDDDDEQTDSFTREVENDSRMAIHFEELERLREHNRLANIAGQPLAPIPNVDGSTSPAGYNDPIASGSQIAAMSATEVIAWLNHYGLSLREGNDSLDGNRGRLALHLGIGGL